jgi:hypothetical protein
VDTLVKMVWRAYKKLPAGQTRQACEWAPDWGLEEDLAGVGRQGVVEPYYLPWLVRKQSDLVQKVIKEEDTGAWLLAQYNKLIENCAYSFLSLDPQQQQLVTDLPKLYRSVGGWGMTAHRMLHPSAPAQKRKASLS